MKGVKDGASTLSCYRLAAQYGKLIGMAPYIADWEADGTQVCTGVVLVKYATQKEAGQLWNRMQQLPEQGVRMPGFEETIVKFDKCFKELLIPQTRAEDDDYRPGCALYGNELSEEFMNSTLGAFAHRPLKVKSRYTTGGNDGREQSDPNASTLRNTDNFNFARPRDYDRDRDRDRRGYERDYDRDYSRRSSSSHGQRRR